MRSLNKYQLKMNTKIKQNSQLLNQSANPSSVFSTYRVLVTCTADSGTWIQTKEHLKQSVFTELVHTAGR